MLKQKVMTLKTSYKFWSFIACFVPSIGLIGITYVKCDIALIVLMIAGLGAFNSAQYSGFQSNHILLTKEYAGTIFGICSMIANMTGFIAPLVTGYIVSGNQTLEQWRIAFCLAGGINIAGSIFYMFTASVEEQEYGSKGGRTDEDNIRV
uniref:Major facilitator superfamily (MFS) profile domain-containing protein n=1 Tax=Megaselia scalaris TaxID=36166 RepID=T1H291_MEGSC